VSEQDDELIARIAAHLRRPVPADPGFDARILAAVAAAPRPRARWARLAAAWHWLRRPRTVRLSPLGALAAAGAALILLLLRPGPVARPPAGADRVAIQFVYVDPAASSVALVGDFNGWDPAATPLARAPAGELWIATVPLPPGRHRYAFIVDGARWAPDPTAPRAGGEDFGLPNSVVTVGGDL
jgi:hypothetical protein